MLTEAKRIAGAYDMERPLHESLPSMIRGENKHRSALAGATFIRWRDGRASHQLNDRSVQLVPKQAPYRKKDERSTKHLLASLRLGALLLVGAAITGCGSLQAVRDFTKQSAQLAVYGEVTERFIANPQAMLEHAPPTKAFEGDRERLKKSGEARAQRRDSLMKIHAVVAGYMGSLANLAGEDAFSLSSSISKVEGALVAAPDLGINPDTVSAFAKIASVVSNWITEAIQVKEVKAMVSKHGDAMDQMLAGMEDVTTTMIAILEEDEKMVANFADYYEGGFRFSVGSEQDPPPGLSASAREAWVKQRDAALIRRDAAGLLVRRSNAAMRAEQRATVESSRAVLTGVQSVRAGHTEMRNNVDRLNSEQVTALLRRLTGDIQAIRENLKGL